MTTWRTAEVALRGAFVLRDAGRQRPEAGDVRPSAKRYASQITSTRDEKQFAFKEHPLADSRSRSNANADNPQKQLMFAHQPIRELRNTDSNQIGTSWMTVPHFNDRPPQSTSLTPYDERHLATYLRLLDAATEGAQWEEVVRIVFGLDPVGDRERARSIHDAHLARARWMAEHGYWDLLNSVRH